MVVGLKLRASVQGFICPTIGTVHHKLPSRILCNSWSRFEKCNSTRVTPRKRRDGWIQGFRSRDYALPVGRSHHLPISNEDFDQEPFWSFMLKEALRFVKWLIIFLIEQPSQLKYIEWPGFLSTLKTATLTLLLVGLLIIALASVDSVLCYILSLLSRRRI